MNTDEENAELDHGRLTEDEEAPESASKPHGDEGIHDDKRYGETNHVDTDEETSNLDTGRLTESESSDSNHESEEKSRQEEHDDEQKRYMGGNPTDENDKLAKKLGDRRGMPQDS